MAALQGEDREQVERCADPAAERRFQAPHDVAFDQRCGRGVRRRSGGTWIE
jgi:hypothetical protein